MTHIDPHLPAIRTETISSIDGTPLGIRHLGSGSPIVLVHGSVSTGESWIPVASFLAADHSVFVLDRRGRGLSGDAHDYTVSTEAADIAAVVARASEETGAPPTLLGHSYGAICTLEAVRVGLDVAALVLYEPPLPVDGPVAGNYLAPYAAAVAASDYDAAMRIALEHFVRLSRAEIEMMVATPMWGEFLHLAPSWTRELAETDRSVTHLSEYGSLAVRSLLLVGEYSPAHLVGASAFLESKLPNATRQVLEGQGHSANVMTPSLIADAIHSFMVQ
ncbi:alpha/beta fold hydrolase [Rhodococcus baikonurensis]|uniref:alpha/beta fold hydrolase n=1 Tax=Rhodococcus baikonurensis TaxID=172041 RepID=UPI00379EEA94